MEKSEFRVLIKHCFLMGKNTIEAKEWLEKHYGDSAPSYSAIKKWFAEFRRGRTSTNDAERSGRPNDAIIPEINQQVSKIVLEDQRVKVREIAETVGISIGSTVKILHEHLHMKKLNVKWVPHFLDTKQKKKKFKELGWELLPHPPYSPDLAPSDYYLFSNLKKWLAGKKFYSNEEVEWETNGYFGLLDKNHYSKGIAMLKDRWTKCIELDGDYIE